MDVHESIRSYRAFGSSIMRQNLATMFDFLHRTSGEFAGYARVRMWGRLQGRKQLLPP